MGTPVARRVRRSRPRAARSDRRGVLLLATALLAPLLVACGTDPDAAGGGTPGGGSSACPAVAGVPAPRELRDRLDLGDLVVWERVAAEDASVNAVGVVEGGAADAGVPGVLAEVQQVLDEQAWEVFSLDDEGFEAEVLARDAADVLLGVTLREAACPGRVELTLSITDYTALG